MKNQHVNQQDIVILCFDAVMCFIDILFAISVPQKQNQNLQPQGPVHLHVVSLSFPPVIGVFQPPCRTLPDGAHWHWYQSGPQKRAWLHDVSLLDLCDYKACVSMLASINGTSVNLLDQTSVVSDQIVIKEHGGGSNRIG